MQCNFKRLWVSPRYIDINSLNYDYGRITERQFAELLLAYADYSAKKRSAVLKRVKKAYKVTSALFVFFRQNIKGQESEKTSHLERVLFDSC